MCFRKGHRRACVHSAFCNRKGHLLLVRSFCLSPLPIPGVLFLCLALHLNALCSVASSPWCVLHFPSHSDVFCTTPLREFLSCPCSPLPAGGAMLLQASPLPDGACFPFKNHPFKPFVSPPRELTSRLCAHCPLYSTAVLGALKPGVCLAGIHEALQIMFKFVLVGVF